MGDATTLTYSCRFCGRNVTLERGSYEELTLRLIDHFNLCSPPGRGIPTTLVLQEADRIAQQLATS